MSRANTRELVGSTALVREAPDQRLMISDKLYRLRPIDGLRPLFLVRVLNGRRVRAQIETATSGASGSMQNISQGLVGSLEIPDLPLPEQEAMEAAVEEMWAGVSESQASAAKFRQRLLDYRDSLITEAVTGALDVSSLTDQLLDDSTHAAIESHHPQVLLR